MKRTVLALLTLLLPVVTACGDAGGEQASDPGPATLAPTEPGDPVAPGFNRVTCKLTTEDRSLRVVLDLPSKIVPKRTLEDGAGNSCRYDDDRPGTPEVVVMLLNEDEAANEEDDISSLADYHATFDDPTNEVIQHDVVWETSVPVFGKTYGDRLVWADDYEGIPVLNFRAEADGVQVWLNGNGGDGARAKLERLFEQITGSVRRG